MWFFVVVLIGACIFAGVNLYRKHKKDQYEEGKKLLETLMGESSNIQLNIPTEASMIPHIHSELLETFKKLPSQTVKTENADVDLYLSQLVLMIQGQDYGTSAHDLFAIFQKREIPLMEQVAIIFTHANCLLIDWLVNYYKNVRLKEVKRDIDFIFDLLLNDKAMSVNVGALMNYKNEVQKTLSYFDNYN